VLRFSPFLVSAGCNRLCSVCTLIPKPTIPASKCSSAVYDLTPLPFLYLATVCMYQMFIQYLKAVHFQSEIWRSARWGVQEWHSWPTVGKFLTLMCHINTFFVTRTHIHNPTRTVHTGCLESLFTILRACFSLALYNCYLFI
jgi:hypothetical protein